MMWLRLTVNNWLWIDSRFGIEPGGRWCRQRVYFELSHLGLIYPNKKFQFYIEVKIEDFQRKQVW